MFYWFSFYLILFIAAIFSPRTVIGKENIPPKGPCILASNHASNIDPFMIGLCMGRRISYMAKDDLFRHPVLRWMLVRVEAFPVRRGSADVWALRETLRRLKRGLPVVMFPQGTRKSSTVQSGLGFLALKSDVPVVPVHIEGSHKVLPPGAGMPKRNRITLSFGKPMTFSKDQSYEEIVDQVMSEIDALSKKS